MFPQYLYYQQRRLYFVELALRLGLTAITFAYRSSYVNVGPVMVDPVDTDPIVSPTVPSSASPIPIPPFHSLSDLFGARHDRCHHIRRLSSLSSFFHYFALLRQCDC